MRITFTDVLEFLIQYAFFLMAASVHESAHAWMAYKLGDPTAKEQNRISLNPANHIDIVGTIIIPFFVFLSHIPIIGWAKPTPVDPRYFANPKRDDMFVAAAGPISNFLSVGVLVLVWHLVLLSTPFTGEIGYMSCNIITLGIFVNLMLGVFNLLPIHPLDGSGVLTGLLPHDAAIAYQRLAPYGMFILLALFYLTGLTTYIWGIVLWFAELFGIQFFRF